MSRRMSPWALYEDGASQEASFMNLVLTRYPVQCSAVLIAVGLAMTMGMYYIPTPAILVVVGPILIVMGALVLLIWLGGIAVGLTRRAVSPPPDPILPMLREAGDGAFARRTYGQSKAEMIKLVVARLSIPSDEARERIEKLERQGKLVYLPSGRWEIGE